MNTINALFFLPGSEDVFVSGSRDGYIKVHDMYIKNSHAT